MLRHIIILLISLLISSSAIAKAERVKAEDTTPSDDLAEESARSVIDVMRIIKEEYVIPVSDSKLAEAAISGMLSSLDPHSAYLNREDASEMSLHSSGEFEGVGIEVTSDNGLIRVVTPIDGGPAYNAGIRAGDYIVSIDGENIYGMASHDVVQKIRGKPNTIIKLSILREDSSTPIEIKLRRDKIKIHSVSMSPIENNIIYIRISYFYGNTAKLFEEGIKKILKENKNVNGIVLDLRNNPGGFFDQSIKISSNFIEQGDIVYTKGKNDSSAITYSSDPNSFKIKNIPVVVLINNGTASAAEIVAGALQYHKKAAILGTKSFGKGSVQTIVDIDKDKAISLTTALYYTPSGKSIQLEGVTPDITIEDIEVKKYKAHSDFREKDMQGRLEQDKNIKNIDKPSFLENMKKKIYLNMQAHPTQRPMYNGDFMLIRAVDLLKGVNIYNNKNNSPSVSEASTND